jgi:hypothetical protein
MNTVQSPPQSNATPQPPVANPTTKSPPDRDEQFVFTTPVEAVEAAKYIEQLFVAEQSWLTNRQSWLYLSQSFCKVSVVASQGWPKERSELQREV